MTNETQDQSMEQLKKLVATANDETRVWRDNIQAQVKSITERQGEIGVRQAALEMMIAENVRAINSIDSNTAEVVSLLQSLKGAFRVLEIFGKIAKPLAAISTAVGAVVAAWVWLRDHIHFK